jgi:predicted DNA-binding antitoxin AbrB/MazE fold protein
MRRSKAMGIVIEAMYENGSFRPKAPVDLADGSPVRLVVDVIEDEPDPLDEVIGVIKGGPDFSLAERHDEILYGTSFRREEPQP